MTYIPFAEYYAEQGVLQIALALRAEVEAIPPEQHFSLDDLVLVSAAVSASQEGVIDVLLTSSGGRLQTTASVTLEALSARLGGFDLLPGFSCKDVWT